MGSHAPAFALLLAQCTMDIGQGRPAAPAERCIADLGNKKGSLGKLGSLHGKFMGKLQLRRVISVLNSSIGVYTGYNDTMHW